MMAGIPSRLAFWLCWHHVLGSEPWGQRTSLPLCRENLCAHCGLIRNMLHGNWLWNCSTASGWGDFNCFFVIIFNEIRENVFWYGVKICVSQAVSENRITKKSGKAFSQYLDFLLTSREICSYSFCKILSRNYCFIVFANVNSKFIELQWDQTFHPLWLNVELVNANCRYLYVLPCTFWSYPKRQLITFCYLFFLIGIKVQWARKPISLIQITNELNPN